MTTHAGSQNTVAMAAAEWAMLLDSGGLSSTDRAALVEWMLVSPRHVEELLLAITILSDCGEVDPEKRIVIEDLLAQGSSGIISISENAVANAATPAAPARVKKQRRIFTAIAASVLLAIGASVLYVNTPTKPGLQQRYVTLLGEQRNFTLEDGSIIHLNTQSEIFVAFSNNERLVKLVSGEAMFKVARSPNRPFRVLSDNAQIQVIGTEFNVYRQNRETTITVAEGKVLVNSLKPAKDKRNTNVDSDLLSQPTSNVILTAGQQVALSSDGVLSDVTTADLEQATSWITRQLVFRSKPLADVVAEFNRYNRLKIQLEDPALANSPISGVFSADDPQSLIDFLLFSKAIQTAQREEQVVVLTR